MKVKLFIFLLTSLSPFLFFAKNLNNFFSNLNTSQAPNKTISFNGDSEENNNLLISEQGWTVRLNHKFCKLIDRVNYSETSKFVVKCTNNSISNSKELTLSSFLLISDNSLSFWLDRENLNLIYFYNLSNSRISKINNASWDLENCLFISFLNNQFQSPMCLIDWRRFDKFNELGENLVIRDGKIFKNTKFDSN